MLRTPVPFRMSTLAVVLLAMVALACAANVARAEMMATLGGDCFGPDCPQQIMCARPDDATLASKQIAGPPGLAATTAAQLVAPAGHTTAVAPLVAVANWRPITSLAPRSPPTA